MDSISNILVTASATVVLVLVDALVIWLVIDKILQYSQKWNRGFKTALEIAAIVGIVGFVLSVILLVFSVLSSNLIVKGLFFLAPLGVMLWLIEKTYHLGWRKAVTAWLIVVLVEMLAGLLIGRIIGMLI